MQGPVNNITVLVPLMLCESFTQGLIYWDCLDGSSIQSIINFVESRHFVDDHFSNLYNLAVNVQDISAQLFYSQGCIMVFANLNEQMISDADRRNISQEIFQTCFTQFRNVLFCDQESGIGLVFDDENVQVLFKREKL